MRVFAMVDHQLHSSYTRFIVRKVGYQKVGPSVCLYVYPFVCPSGQGQTMYFLVNASPPKVINVATANFAGVNVL